MRVFASLLCATATLAAAPAFAQAGKDSGPVSAAPGGLATALQKPVEDSARSSSFVQGFGFIDRLSVSHGAERPVPSLAPIEKDQLILSWRPSGKWGITLDLTSRGENEVLPREEITAGAYYQVTPRFRFGGGVSVGSDELTAGRSAFRKEDFEAGVRIESAFSF